MDHISRGRRQRVGLAAATVCAGLLAAACSGTATQPTAVSPVPASSSNTSQHQPGRSGSPGSSKSATPGTRTAPAAGPGPASPSPPAPLSVLPCPTSGLRGSFGVANGAAGTFYYPVQFTNTSGSACTLLGYPGLSVVTSPSGSQIGAAAVRIPTFSPQLVTLAPGATVHAPMQLPDPGNFGPGICKPATVRWLRVYPPGQFTPLYISVPAMADPVQICTGQHLGGIIPLGTFVVMPGSTGP